MPAIQEQVTRKLGPLPVWQWALVVGGGVIGFRILTGRSATPSVSAPPVSDLPDTSEPPPPVVDAELLTQIEDILKRLGLAEDAIEDLTTRISANELSITDVLAAFDLLETRVDENETNITNIFEQLGDITGRLDIIEATPTIDVGAFTSWQTLVTKLINAIEQRDNVDAQMSLTRYKIALNRNNWQAAKEAKNTTLITKYQTEYDSLQKVFTEQQARRLNWINIINSIQAEIENIQW